MLFNSALLVLLGLSALASAESKIEKVPSVVTCSSGCHQTNEDACKKGCMFAYALTFAPGDYAHNPSCQDSCKDTFPDSDKRTACETGCGNFRNDVPHVVLSPDTGNSALANFFNHCRRRAQEMSESLQRFFGRFASNQGDSPTAELNDGNGGFFDRKMSEMLQGIRGLFSNSGTEQQGNVESSPDEPVFSTHVRILFLSKPDDENNEDSAISQANEAKQAMNSFISSKLGESRAAENTLPLDERVITGRRKVCYGFLNYLRHVFANPFNLLLGLTLFALLVLFIAQIVLYVHRRPRRSLGHEYTRLPTYAEAVEIKIPMSVEEYTVKETEKSKSSGDDAQA